MRTLLLTLTTCLFVLPAYAKYSGGTGEPNDPYQIATAAGLIALGETPEDCGKHFILTADIDLDPNLPGRKVFDKAVIAPHTNDAAYWFDGIPLTGVVDGNGHTISHLTIVGGSYLGLFGVLGSGAEVRDLGIADANITGAGESVGELVGINSGIVMHCWSTGTVVGDHYVGGLVGQNCYGAMTECYSTSTVSGWVDVGGLVGSNWVDPPSLSVGSWDQASTVCKCCSAGVVGGTSGVGGLVGGNTGVIADSHASGVVAGESAVGGLVGGNGACGQFGCRAGTVLNCYSVALVTGTQAVGGLVGSNLAGQINSSFWDIEVSGPANMCGWTPDDANGCDDASGKTTPEMQTASTFLEAGWDFVGEIENGIHDVWQMPPGGGYPTISIPGRYEPAQLRGTGTPEDPYAISDARELGAIIHYSPHAHYRLTADIDLSDVRWSTAVIPLLAGTFDGNGHIISHLTIKTTTEESDVGMFGRLEHGAEVKNLGVVDVNISVSGSDNTSKIGGLVGWNDGTVIRCCSTGSVGGGGQYGCLVGWNSGLVSNCYSSVVATGCYLVLVNGGTVTHSYNSFSGLVGVSWYGTGVVTSSLWDTETSGQTWSAGGTGKTTAEMQTASTFLDAGWDFVGETKNGTDDIWWIDEGKDYPRLWWEARD
jgi:hypothetical protein